MTTDTHSPSTRADSQQTKARTAGPWVYRDEKDGRLGIEVFQEHGFHIASVSWRKQFGDQKCNRDQAEANAHFIVQACNAHEGLISALREASILIKDCYGDECAETEEIDRVLASLANPKPSGAET